MKTIYIPVKASEELPEENGIFHTIGSASEDGARHYESALFSNGQWDEDYYTVEFWLKEVTISEDEIEEMVDNYDSLVEFINPSKPQHCILPEHYRLVAKSILNLITK